MASQPYVQLTINRRDQDIEGFIMSVAEGEYLGTAAGDAGTRTARSPAGCDCTERLERKLGTMGRPFLSPPSQAIRSVRSPRRSIAPGDRR